jgi:hypothetical protein
VLNAADVACTGAAGGGVLSVLMARDAYWFRCLASGWLARDEKGKRGPKESQWCQVVAA